jgi:hypothetical protein
MDENVELLFWVPSAINYKAYKIEKVKVEILGFSKYYLYFFKVYGNLVVYFN